MKQRYNVSNNGHTFSPPVLQSLPKEPRGPNTRSAITERDQGLHNKKYDKYRLIELQYLKHLIYN